ncbi:MAG: hypothetical protein EXR71_11660 [Myxococcales bacterium]|nr:hypothetical protein [Myxococcales bacterium]
MSQRLQTGLVWDGTPARPEEVVTVFLTVTGEGLVIDVDAPFHDDPAPAAPIGPTWKLWEHEVVEVFVAAGMAPEYVEVELSPHGHHLVLRLVGIRNDVGRCLPLIFSATIEGARWRGRAVVPADCLPPGAPGAWRVNANAIHGCDPERRYLTAARLTAPTPDFHRPEEFLPSRL